ncbi:MAG: PLP-dependent aminotransferase family protein, partial [Candidatus Dormibacteraeota bacterium]|nr:PLP-dependent aminotransferase family protein [Candidatus Dormibacteraeota bacterium]
AIQRAIVTGELGAEGRLPPVRTLAGQLNVSTATVAAAYALLRSRGLAGGHVGRGTFVSTPDRQVRGRGESRPDLLQSAVQPWRKRALALSERRLGGDHPHAIDCARGGPDSTLMPVEAIRRAYRQVLDATSEEDLGYPVRDEPAPELVAQLLGRLERDGIGARAQQLVIGGSTQQFVSLLTHAFVSRHAATEPLVAVEEPGHHSAMDALERAGCRLIGADLDGEGVRPESLERALSQGATMVFLTPRAQSPTGASWTPERRAALADVLRRFPDALVLEDDHFGEVAAARPGSLLNEPGVGDRVLYVRSFSKALAPDLRLAAGVCGERIVAAVREAKYFADGWTSHVTQRVVAALLADAEVGRATSEMRRTYQRRRRILEEGLQATLGSDEPLCFPGRDGLHCWVRLPRGCDSSEVLTHAAGLGLIAATGEPFFVKPGNGGFVRVNSGGVGDQRARVAGEILGRAILETVRTAAAPITV